MYKWPNNKNCHNCGHYGKVTPISSVDRCTNRDYVYGYSNFTGWTDEGYLIHQYLEAWREGGGIPHSDCPGWKEK